MPFSSQQAKYIKNLTTILWLEIKQSAFKAMLNIDDKEKSKEDNNIKKLIANLISIKKKRCLSKQIRLERPPDIYNQLSFPP
jgi:hypothetical protein